MSQGSEFESLTVAVFTGKANPMLAQEIARHLHVQLGRADVGRFSDGEVSVELMENVRGRDVFIVQPTNPPAENLMELLMMTDACRRASAKRVTAGGPYFGYGRPGCRRGGAGPGIGEAPGRCGIGHHRQTPAAAERVESDEHHRRGRRPDLCAD